MSHESPKEGSPKLPEHERQARIRTLQGAITTRLSEIEVLQEELAKLNPADMEHSGKSYNEPYPVMIPGENDNNDDPGVDPLHEDADIHDLVNDLEEIRQKDLEKRKLRSTFDDMFGGIDLRGKDEKPKMYSKLMGRISIHADISSIANKVTQEHQKDGLTSDELLRHIFSACLEDNTFAATEYTKILRQELHGDLDARLVNLIQNGASEPVNNIGKLCKEHPALQSEYNAAKQKWGKINPGSDMPTRRDALKILVQDILKNEDTKLRAYLLQVSNLI